jgi:hypothetical protein
LDAGRTAQVEAHLSGCAACAAEREALSTTIRLLRAMPESAPPAELRRRIGVALLEEQRRAERRWLGLPWLARPQSAAWAWGAAAGAVLAVGGLIATRGPVSSPPMSAVPSPPAVRGRAAESAVVPKGTVLARTQESKLELKKKPGSPPAVALERQAPTLNAPLMAKAAGPVLPKPSSLEPETSQPEARRPVRTTERHSLTRSRRPASSAPRHVPAPGRPEATGRDTPLLASDDPMPPTAAPSDGSMDGSEMGTSGMTQMASTVPPMETTTDSSDDLDQLRSRLIKRPLQVPDLGELRPSDDHRSNREGWIRF